MCAGSRNQLQLTSRLGAPPSCAAPTHARSDTDMQVLLDARRLRGPRRGAWCGPRSSSSCSRRASAAPTPPSLPTPRLATSIRRSRSPACPLLSPACPRLERAGCWNDPKITRETPTCRTERTEIGVFFLFLLLVLVVEGCCWCWWLRVLRQRCGYGARRAVCCVQCWAETGLGGSYLDALPGTEFVHMASVRQLRHLRRQNTLQVRHALQQREHTTRHSTSSKHDQNPQTQRNLHAECTGLRRFLLWRGMRRSCFREHASSSNSKPDMQTETTGSDMADGDGVCRCSSRSCRRTVPSASGLGPFEACNALSDPLGSPRQIKCTQLHA